MNTPPTKPLGQRAYGSVPHLPGSRRGPGDKGLSEQQASILTTKTRDKHDLITVQEKLDGSCCSVARLDGCILALIRAGYSAIDSKYPMHHAFANWAQQHRQRFGDLLDEGERCVGEWLMQAHGTRYAIRGDPFVIFDIMAVHDRMPAAVVKERCERQGFITPRIIHIGGAIGIEDVIPKLEPSGHGAIDPVEGAVWRCERKGEVDFLGKFVIAEKVDGKYLECVTGNGPVWNWQP